MSASVLYPTRIGPVELVAGARSPRLQANSLFVHGAGLLIDTGAGEGALRALRDGGSVRRVLYTHYHSDHRWYGPLFEGIETWASVIDGDTVEDPEKILAAIGAPPELERGFRKWQRLMGLEAVTVHHRIPSEDPLDFGGVSVVPLLMPGHTPGLICPWFPEQRLLFLADYDLTPFGPWYANVGSDIDALEASLQRIADFDADWFMTSHHPTAVDREEMLRLLEPFGAHVQRRDERIFERLAEPCTIEDLSGMGLVYRREHIEGNRHLAFFERAHVEKHLARMERRGQAVRDGDRWRRT